MGAARLISLLCDLGFYPQLPSLQWQKMFRNAAKLPCPECLGSRLSLPTPRTLSLRERL